MGGYVALHLAQQHPEAIQQLFTLGTKFDWSPETAQQEIRMLNPEKISAKIPAFAKALETRHHPNDWAAVLQQTANLMVALGDQPLVTPESVKTIQMPVTIGWGALDKMVSQVESERMANALPNGTFEQFQDTPHPIEQVNMEVLSTQLIRFFNPT